MQSSANLVATILIVQKLVMGRKFKTFGSFIRGLSFDSSFDIRRHKKCLPGVKFWKHIKETYRSEYLTTQPMSRQKEFFIISDLFWGNKTESVTCPHGTGNSSPPPFFDITQKHLNFASHNEMVFFYFILGHSLRFEIALHESERDNCEIWGYLKTLRHQTGLFSRHLFLFVSFCCTLFCF